ncbi:MAG: hypothetical protein NXH75_04520 [Halobacteriovoraceae bacterium]|nr:hypothetical protein [Halobacteriovoraceae bacterium]
MEERTISYLNVPSFPIALERIQDPRLKEREVAVAPRSSDRAKVWAVSSEAREAGITKGMPVGQAKRIAPSLTIIEPNPDLYKQVNRKLETAIKKWLPVYEFEREGKIYLDYTGFRRLYGGPEDFSLQLKRLLKNDFSLDCSLGHAANKLVAKAAAKEVIKESRPSSFNHHILRIEQGQEAPFLRPLEADVLPVVRTLKSRRSSRTHNVFDELNLRTVQDLARLDRLYLTVAFGPFHAETIYKMARGIDPRPVVPPKLEPTVFCEEHLEKESNNVFDLNFKMENLLEDVCRRLRVMGQHAGSLTVGLRYSDYKYVEKKKTFDDVFQYQHQVARELRKVFTHLLNRRVTIRYLSLEACGLKHSEIQLSLFDECRNLTLDKALDEINNKFESKVILGRKLLA